MYDFVDYVMMTFVGMLLLIVVCLAIFIGYDVVYLGIKSEPHLIACRQQQMEPMRITLTDSVVCVPYATRRDTLSIQEVK